MRIGIGQELRRASFWGHVAAGCQTMSRLAAYRVKTFLPPSLDFTIVCIADAVRLAQIIQRRLFPD